MELIKVESSVINGIGYSQDTEILTIEFKGNNKYNYKEVPKEVFEMLLGAESIGKALNTMIKGIYSFEKVV